MPSTPKHGNTTCDHQKISKVADSLLALQSLAEECGLGDVAVRAYTAHVRASMPAQPQARPLGTSLDFQPLFKRCRLVKHLQMQVQISDAQSKAMWGGQHAADGMCWGMNSRGVVMDVGGGWRLVF